MKTYSIGRDLNCNIVINDTTDVISRRHALLNVAPNGKMTIIDQSGNGTYVNGIRISQNVPVPVTRKDTISFAHVARLDWSQVPNPNQWMKFSIIGLIAVVVIVASVFGVKHLINASGSNDIAIHDSIMQDSITNVQKNEPQDSLKKKAEQDSIAKAKANNDSLHKVKQDEKKKSKTEKSVEKSKDTKIKDKKHPEHKQETKKPARAAG